MGSSFNDVVKYSASLTMDLEKRGHSKSYVALVIFAALAMLFFQMFLVISLNSKNDALLFCGDVVTKIDTMSDDSKKMFQPDSVYSFNRTWYAQANIL